MALLQQSSLEIPEVPPAIPLFAGIAQRGIMSDKEEQNKEIKCVAVRYCALL